MLTRDKRNVQMDELEAKALKEKKAAKRKYKKQLTVLRSKRAKNEKNLEALNKAATESCKLLTAETENVWNTFKESVNQYTLYFK